MSRCFWINACLGAVQMSSAMWLFRTMFTGRYVTCLESHAKLQRVICLLTVKKSRDIFLQKAVQSRSIPHIFLCWRFTRKEKKNRNCFTVVELPVTREIERLRENEGFVSC